MPKPDETTAQSAEPTRIELNPYRADWVYLVMRLAGRGNPVLTGFIYMALSFGVPMLIAYSTNKMDALKAVEHRMVLFKLLLFAPIGAAVLCYFYETTRKSFRAVDVSELLPLEQRAKYYGLLEDLQKFYNNKWLMLGAIVGSLALNIANHFWWMRESWLSWGGGAVSVYCRLNAVLSFYMLMLVGAKIVYTCRWLWKMFSLDIVVHPLHPDGVGGLHHFGKVTLAINYFILFVIIYFGLTFLLLPQSRKALNVIWFASFYLASPIFMFGPLWKAHKKMVEARDRILTVLSATFDHYCQEIDLKASIIPCDLNSAEEVKKINVLYQTVEKMSLWPFPAASVKRYITTMAVPLAIFVYKEIDDKHSISQWLLDWLGHGHSTVQPANDCLNSINLFLAKVCSFL